MILNRNNFSLIALFFLLFFSACEKEELPVQKRNLGELTANAVEMGEDYGLQIYFDLETNNVVSTNLKTAWDLAFESSPQGWRVILNSSRGMAVYPSDLSFAGLTSSTGAIWQWDAHSGNRDSTAVGNWTDENKTYLIDLGFDIAKNHMGYVKLVLNNVTETQYSLTYGNLDDPEGTTFTLPKNTSNALTFFSFADGVVAIAPPNPDYDLVFTQYIHLFDDGEGGVTAYLVTGVLLNRVGTKAYLLNDVDFNAITRSQAEGLELSEEINTIGYDWKVYDYENDRYIIDPVKQYIIHTSEGFYYKFRFTSFYGESGIKGTPNFEFQQL